MNDSGEDFEPRAENEDCETTESDGGFADRMDGALAALWSGSADALDRVVSEVTDDELETEVVAAIEPTGLVHGGVLPSIPGYEIRAVFGRGGMGVVYRAVQESPRRTVAIKVLRAGAAAGPRDIELFQREIAALARLRHPGIATIHETGHTADGSPWFSMEPISGSPLVCEARSMATIGERLGLFLQVCEAVQFANEGGVIHRDLKPSNVMVDRQGRVKVLDFGLARLLEPEGDGVEGDEGDETVSRGPRTGTGIMLGTAPYMSPEQVHGLAKDIDERTDVHALGILLAEVLTGELPYRVDPARAFESARVVLEDVPRAPSSIDPRVPRDLDAVVLKAIEKAPEDRYPSVAHMAEDLRRFLSGNPVRATRPTPWYWLRKWAARRRAWAAAATVAIAAVLFGVAAIGYGFARAKEASASTARAHIDLDALIELLRSVVFGADPRRGVPVDRTARDILIDLAERMNQELASSPEIGALIRSDIGAALHGIGQLAEAERQLRMARPVLIRLRDRDDPELARATRSLGHLLHAMSRLSEAEALLTEALRAQRASLGDLHADTFTTRNDLGWLMQAMGRPDEAESWFRENADRARALETIFPEDLSYHVGALGHYLLQTETGDAEARSLLQEAIAIAESEGAAVHQAAEIRVHLALAASHDKRYERALSELDSVIEELERNKLGGGLAAAEAWAARGQVLTAAGMPKEAQRSYRESIRRSTRCAGPTSPLTLCRRSSLARALFADGQIEDAARILNVVIETEAGERGADTMEYAKHLLVAATFDFERKGLAEALIDLRTVEEIVARTVGISHPLAFDVQFKAGGLAKQAGAWQTAADHFARAIACAVARGPAALQGLGRAQYEQGLCWMELEDPDRAAPFFEAAIHSLKQWPEDKVLAAAVRARERSLSQGKP